MDRPTQLEAIRRAIARHGYYRHVAAGGPSGRCAYTIGLSESSGAEVVLDGALLFRLDAANTIVATAVRALAGGGGSATTFAVDGCGDFSLRDVHPTWVHALLLGATDYYGRAVPALQILPDAAHHTIEIRDLSGVRIPRDVPDAPAEAVTGLDVLRGGTVTHAARFGDDDWELFTDEWPDDADIRRIPVDTLIAHDPTLVLVRMLEVGTGIRRDSATAPWLPWGDANN